MFMSQEEEKLIEELEEYKWYYYLNELSPGNVGEMLIFINKKINEAYHAGKLAGFEVCEKLLPNKIEDPVIGEAFMWNSAVHQFKILFEEEKKKL